MTRHICLKEVERATENNHSFNILSLNSQSIHAKIGDLRALLHDIHERNLEISAICIQESWLSKDADLSLLHIDDYTCISQGKTASAHGGLIIYLNTKYKYCTRKMTSDSNIWEGQLIEITGNSLKKKITLGNIYKPPKIITTIITYKHS